jgi:Flp pilus assembly protein TadD
MHRGRGASRIVLSLFVWGAAAGLSTFPVVYGQSALLTTEGRVEVARAGTAAWTAGRTNQPLQIRDQVRTGLRSRATVRLSDLTLTRLDELTTIEIQPPGKAGNKPVLEQRSGMIYFLNRERPTEVEFRTPQASGAIRGTEFNLAVTADGRTVLTLIDGEVALSNPQGELVLSSGEQATVQAGQAPTKTAVIDAINIIQWALYYPVIVDLNDLRLTAGEEQALGDSLAAYRSGELLRALAVYPEARQPGSDDEKIYLAGLLLSVGRVEQSEAILDATTSPITLALRQLIAAVKNQSFTLTLPRREAEARRPYPPLSTEWMAESYYRQSQHDLEGAWQAARQAVARSPDFSFAHVRLAELEFGFGNTDRALAALNGGLRLSPRNPQAHSLRGFLLAAQNDNRRSLESFDQAIAIDSALGNAWLGRGLARIRRGDDRGGREDMQVAAILEPHRSLHRSYLGKAFGETRDQKRAEKELGLARKLDPNDPTPWLYSALLKQQQNRINESVDDLERSQELNNNRSLFRSRFLLDQDRAVRSANLAAIYRDAGFTDVSIREAQRAVSYDYANYSAHLFLAGSYDALRDPKSVNLRYETPFFSELLVGNLLAPVGGGTLSQNISQGEYSRFFDGDHFGVISDTEYLSYGHWIQSGSQYGNVGNTSYAIDAFYRSDNGQRPNNDLEQLSVGAKIKQQLTRKDSVYLEANYYHAKFGDVAQYYDPNQASGRFRGEEWQEPNLLAGYHREWSPGNHTLFLAARFDDTLKYSDPEPTIRFFRHSLVSGRIISVGDAPGIGVNYNTDLEAYSAELQQLFQRGDHTTIVGGRYQAGWSDTTAELRQQFFGTTLTNQNVETSLDRASVYGYHLWQIFAPLQLTAGVSYDHLHYPRNNDAPPVNDQETSKDRVSPKFGFVLTPLDGMHIRGAYTRSLGGVYFDTSVRLEPTQVAGFNQAFRSLAPESVAGLVPGTEFETFGLGIDQLFRRTRTYVAAEAELLRSDARFTIGVLTNSGFPVPDSASSTRQWINFEEKSLFFSVNQLLSDEWSLGARYRLSAADLDLRLLDVASTVPFATNINRDVTAILHQVTLYANFNHPSGLFAQANSIWNQQSNQHYTPDLPGDDFWQVNLYLGWRFYRRHAELRVGLLNVTDQDYRLNPLNLYNELPRDRTLAVNFKFYF